MLTAPDGVDGNLAAGHVQRQFAALNFLVDGSCNLPAGNNFSLFIDSSTERDGTILEVFAVKDVARHLDTVEGQCNVAFVLLIDGQGNGGAQIPLAANVLLLGRPSTQFLASLNLFSMS